MPKSAPYFLILLSGFTLAGCGQFASVTLDRNTMTGVTQVAMTGPPEPPRVEFISEEQFLQGAANAAVAGAAAGAAGGAAASQIVTSSANASTASAIQRNGTDPASQGFFPAKEAQSALLSDLKQNGFDVAYFDAPRGTLVQYSFASDYKGAPHSAQVILDVSLSLAYSDGSTDDFIPFVNMPTRLTDRKSGKTLMVKIFRYHGAYGGGDADDLIANSQCNYPSIEAIKQSPGRAISCFREGIKELAQRLAVTLKQ